MDQIEVLIDMNECEARLYLNDESIAKAAFVIDENRIFICDFDVDYKQQKKQFGTILMYTLMGISRAKSLPLVLCSIDSASGFYVKLGFYRIRKFKKGKYKGVELTISNLNNKKSFDEQVGSEDFIWIPPNRKNVVISL